MADSGKFCCFWCPEYDNSTKNLEDSCPTCARNFGFPLDNPPKKIGEYHVVKSLGRGFYGATFVGEKRGIISRKVVLKVIPKSLYEFFKKDFSAECRAHSELAVGADFITGIEDVLEERVCFSDQELDCHVAVLEFLDGHLLSNYLSGEIELTAAKAAQIAADLFRIKDELSRNEVNHNDFHAGNIIIEQLSNQKRREDAMEPSVRAVAIDLGSLAKDRRSGDGYKGDINWIAEHIDRMVSLILSKGDGVADFEARVGMKLRSLAQSLVPETENLRTPNSTEIIGQIRDAFFRTSEPWKPWAKPFSLQRFNDGYNAQTLEAWNVPQLLVDPDDRWQQAISASGPLVVTGMRGCGKTMLLRALEFHARAAQWNEQSRSDVLDKIKSDEFVGFFVSASTLLNVDADNELSASQMYARLIIAYALKAVRALAHLMDIEPDAISHSAPSLISEVLADVLNVSDDVPNAPNIHQLERGLVHLFNKACRSDSELEMVVHPGQGFPRLASNIRQCTEIWSDSQVLFLLDDVSTRYLKENQIQEILSALIFQHPTCAFKLTSESQTIFLVMKSPGGVEHASHGRDFATFDLGSEVHERLKDRTAGKKFLADILQQRASVFTPHPDSVTPAMVLGDKPLRDIALTITAHGKTSKERKNLYHGISALRAVCVGDLGTAITIYDKILEKARDGQLPVPASDQANAFQDMCSTLLYLLDRRNSRFKSVAKSFAAASHKLLMQSANGGSAERLRQYASIYVRVTTGDQEKQLRQLRELVDAGVFVFQNGAARTKTKDSDPTQQFKLTFRRIYGLADNMGLAERDRFELSGQQLQEWLDDPEKGEEILTRNLKSQDQVSGEPTDPEHVPSGKDVADNSDLSVDDQPRQGELELKSPGPKAKRSSQQEDDNKFPVVLPEFNKLSDVGEIAPVDVLYVALGFEERAYGSAAAAIQALKPAKIIAVEYDNSGQGAKMKELFDEQKIPVEVIRYRDVQQHKVPYTSGSCAIDITGMTKAAIFRITTGVLKAAATATMVYTKAETYSPKEQDLEAVIAAEKDNDQATLLTRLKDVLTGEVGPYSVEELHSLESDGTRMQALFAQASAKHERLIHLVEDRDYNYVKVIVDNSNSSRATVARRAAEVAVMHSGAIEDCDIHDPGAVVEALGRMYQDLYLSEGLNVEIGLTGDKIGAFAVSAFAAKIPVNKVLYVKPTKFDPNKFSYGSGETVFFTVKV